MKCNGVKWRKQLPTTCFKNICYKCLPNKPSWFFKIIFMNTCAFSSIPLTNKHHPPVHGRCPDDTDPANRWWAPDETCRPRDRGNRRRRRLPRHHRGQPAYGAVLCAAPSATGSVAWTCSPSGCWLSLSSALCPERGRNHHYHHHHYHHHHQTDAQLWGLECQRRSRRSCGLSVQKYWVKPKLYLMNPS